MIEINLSEMLEAHEEQVCQPAYAETVLCGFCSGSRQHFKVNFRGRIVEACPLAIKCDSVGRITSIDGSSSDPTS